MEFVRVGGYGIGFVCRLKTGGCEGTVTIAYGGRVCGTLTVTNPKKDYVGSVVGDSILEPGETAIYYHDLRPGAEYTGNLPGTIFDSELGHGMICTMDPSANQGATYTVSFSGACGSIASKTVTRQSCDDAPTSGYADSVIGMYVRTPSTVNPDSGYCAYVGSLIGVTATSSADGACSQSEENRWWLDPAGAGSYNLLHRQTDNYEGPVKCYTRTYSLIRD